MKAALANARAAFVCPGVYAHLGVKCPQSLLFDANVLYMFVL